MNKILENNPEIETEDAIEEVKEVSVDVLTDIFTGKEENKEYKRLSKKLDFDIESLFDPSWRK